MQNCQTVISGIRKRYTTTCYFPGYLAHLRDQAPRTHALPAQPNQTQPMRASETEEASGNLFRSRSRLGPSRPSAPVLLTHRAHRSLVSRRGPVTTPTELTALSQDHYCPGGDGICDNARPSDAVVETFRSRTPAGVSPPPACVVSGPARPFPTQALAPRVSMAPRAWVRGTPVWAHLCNARPQPACKCVDMHLAPVHRRDRFCLEKENLSCP